jgi:ABC-2 type transport system permease protein
VSLRNTVKALPTLMRVGVAEAVAYRAEMLVWVLATTMPLIMMALWTAVARDAPIGGFGQEDFVAYFLATFIVRQLTGAWAAWQMNFEVREGTLSMRLLRPLSPVVAWWVEHVSAIPLRILVALPVGMILLLTVGAKHVAHSVALWGVFLFAVMGGFLITFIVGVCIGCLAFFMESSLKVMDVWLASYMVFSGYLIPVELFPTALGRIAAFLPFRYQIGFPVEVLTGRYDLPDALLMLGKQWAFVVGLALLTWAMWRSGLKRFAAYGG